MKRILRLFLFAVVSLVVILLTLNFGLAWVLVSAMTHPFCQNPAVMDGIPAPEEHWLTTEDEISIRIWYYPSQNGAAILTFGGMSGSLGNRLPPAAHLIHAGYGVVQVDTRGCAQPSTPVTQGYYELYDGEAALEFLSERSEIEPQRIGVTGFSMGGATALRIATQHPEIRAVVRDGGFSSLGELLSPKPEDQIPAQIQQATILMLYKLRSGIDPWEVNPISDLKAINPRPILLIYGEYEAGAGWEQFEASEGNVELWIVPNGTHGGNHRIAPEEYERRVLEFFNQNLK